jgi:pimeloyl-ACP methyl ester carboxylesterase
MRIIATFVAIALVLYSGACVGLFLFQRSLIYFPQPKSYGGPDDTTVLRVDGAELSISTRAHAGPKALIYFGGNAEDVSANLASFSKAFPDRALYLMHYRGYGGSTGTSTEALLHSDALALFERVRRDHPDIALMGRSLGTAIALRLAASRPATSLVLVTPYDSIAAVAAGQFRLFPVRWLLTDKFDAIRDAPAVRVPTLILQAERDEVIPGRHTELLGAAFTKGIASRVVIRGVGHNDISGNPEYLDAIRAAL